MMQPSRCIAPPEDRQPEFNEVLADFEARRNTPRILKREFTRSIPHDLFTISEAVASRSPHASYFFTLTDVYFSANGKLAMTGFDAQCGSLCGVFMWGVFEKTALGEWQERQWVNCFGMS